MAKEDIKKADGAEASATPDKGEKKAHPGKDAGKKGASGGKKPGGSGGKHASAEVIAEAEKPAKGPPRLKTMFDSAIRPKLKEKFGLGNPMQHPKLEKIVINVNLGRHLEGTKIPADKKQTAIDTVTKIAAQKPVVVKAKKSVSNFKLRAGYESACVVTMRRERMWNFLDRFINLAAPRVKDFRGFNDKAFDRQGNYSLGVTEQGIFPEINMAEVNFTHGMHVTMVFRNSTPERSKFVMENLGFPFAKAEK